MVELYLWQRATFPHFEWNAEQLIAPLGELHKLQGQLLGCMSSLGFDGINHQVWALTDEIIGSSQIEGITLNADSVRSSVARHLGVELEDSHRTDHYTEGVVNVMMQATQLYNEPLTSERLFAWHSAFFPTGYSDGYKIDVAQWRTGAEPMQVVSGAMGKEKIHFEAPPSEQVPTMMNEFIRWCNTPTDTDPIICAAIAHLWFVTIHPFDDGNGRMTRAITEMMLARADGSSKRFYSLSAEILKQRKGYYDALEKAQKGQTNITDWLLWFIHTLRSAIINALEMTERVLAKSLFWNTHQQDDINERQRKIINYLFDGFEGKLTTVKYAKINHCSQDTALRDIQALISKSILKKTDEGGRSTGYEIIK